MRKLCNPKLCKMDSLKKEGYFGLKLGRISLQTKSEIYQSYGTICSAAFNNPDINLFTFSARFKQKNGLAVKSECFGIVNCDFPSYPWNIIKNMIEFYGIYSMYCATPLAFENLAYFFIRVLLPNNNVDG